MIYLQFNHLVEPLMGFFKQEFVRPKIGAVDCSAAEIALMAEEAEKYCRDICFLYGCLQKYSFSRYPSEDKEVAVMASESVELKRIIKVIFIIYFIIQVLS